MQKAQRSPELADAADVLSDQLRVHLQRFAVLLQPQSDQLDRKFLKHLRAFGFDPKQRLALAAITPGAAARILAGGQPPLKFIEQVEYNGRRLAQLNLPPSAILQALAEYDQLLGPMQSNFKWVREQLHFCVILTLNNAYYQVREAETQAFYELFRVELESRNLDGLLRGFVESLVKVYGAGAGRLYMFNGNDCGLRKKLSRPRYVRLNGSAASMLLDPHWCKRFQSAWSIPLVLNGRTAGVMQFGFAKAYEWLPREQEFLAAAAERCLMAAEKARLMQDLAQREEEIRRLAEHLLQVEERERRRISRELHDEAGQSLLCIRLQMEMIEQALPENAGECRAKLRETLDLTGRTIVEMRRLIAALSPAVLQQLGLGAALRQLANRFARLHPCRIRLQLSKLGVLPEQLEIIAYRLVQECFNNIGKHSAADRINLSLISADGRLTLVVEDNGVGFNLEDALGKRESFGLSGMRERVALLGGKFHVESSIKGTRTGTKISIELPIAR